MNKKLLLILLSFLLCFGLSSCARNKIIESDEFIFEESFEKLEKGIAEKYQLDKFDIVRIRVNTLKGYNAPSVISIQGFYQQDGKREIWSEHWELTDDDEDTLYALNDNHIELVYNELKANSLSDLDNLDYPLPIRTDVPGWVIEGIYNIVFDK